MVMIEFNGFDEGNVGPILKKEEVGFMGFCFCSTSSVLSFSRKELLLLVVKRQARPWHGRVEWKSQLKISWEFFKKSSSTFFIIWKKALLMSIPFYPCNRKMRFTYINPMNANIRHVNRLMVTCLGMDL